MRILRKYQLDVIFLYFAFQLITILLFYWLTRLRTDPHNMEWFISGPLILLYSVYVLRIRAKINITDRRAVTSKTLIYWILLGITMFALYERPLAAPEYLTVNIFFIIFTLFLADSYWDFKKITMKDVVGR